MNLYGDKVMLRPVQEGDFRKIVKWSNLSEIQQHDAGDYPTKPEECGAWYKEIQRNRYQEVYTIVLGSNIIGNVELDHIAWRSGDAELRIRIGEPTLWGKGYGTDAVKTLLNHAFNKLNLNRVYLKVYTTNSRAINCYRKAGFVKEGKLSRRNDKNFRDIYLMRILKQDFQPQKGTTNKVS